jgi:curli biogenesis system outer membrane secretion channel CsgG
VLQSAPDVKVASRWRLRVGAVLTVALPTLSACAPTVSRYATRSAVADSVVRAAIGREREIQAANIPSNTVGVLPLRVRSADTTYASLGYGVAALIASDLARSNRLVIVERLRLDAVMRELDLVRSGRVDTTTAPRVGRIVGARRIIVGDLDIRPNGALQLGSTIANASSGAVDAALSGNATVNQIFDAEKAMVLRLFEALGVTLTPAERRAIEPRPTQSLAALVAFSNGVRAESVRDFDAALQYYQNATRIDPGFTEAGARATTMQGGPVAGPDVTGVARVMSLSNDLVNRPTPVLFGSGVDAPLTRQQLITINIRTP